MKYILDCTVGIIFGWGIVSLGYVAVDKAYSHFKAAPQEQANVLSLWAKDGLGEDGKSKVYINGQLRKSNGAWEFYTITWPDKK